MSQNLIPPSRENPTDEWNRKYAKELRYILVKVRSGCGHLSLCLLSSRQPDSSFPRRINTTPLHSITISNSNGNSISFGYSGREGLPKGLSTRLKTSMVNLEPPYGPKLPSGTYLTRLWYEYLLMRAWQPPALTTVRCTFFTSFSPGTRGKDVPSLQYRTIKWINHQL